MLSYTVTGYKKDDETIRLEIDGGRLGKATAYDDLDGNELSMSRRAVAQKFDVEERDLDAERVKWKRLPSGASFQVKVTEKSKSKPDDHWYTR